MSVGRSAIRRKSLFLLPQERKPCVVLRFASDDPLKPDAMRAGEKRRIGRPSVECARPPGAVVA